MSDPRTIRLKPGVRASLVGGEAIVVSFETGSYFSIQGTGAFIVGALASGPVSEGLVVADIAEAYSGVLLEMIAEGTASFVDALIASRVAEVTDGEREPGRGIELPKDASYGYAAPEEHSELAELITLDPIHEVSPAGWPERA